MSPEISERSFEEASTLRVVPRVGLCGHFPRRVEFLTRTM